VTNYSKRQTRKENQDQVQEVIDMIEAIEVKVIPEEESNLFNVLELPAC